MNLLRLLHTQPIIAHSLWFLGLAYPADAQVWVEHLREGRERIKETSTMQKGSYANLQDLLNQPLANLDKQGKSSDKSLPDRPQR